MMEPFNENQQSMAGQRVGEVSNGTPSTAHSPSESEAQNVAAGSASEASAYRSVPPVTEPYNPYTQTTPPAAGYGAPYDAQQQLAGQPHAGQQPYGGSYYPPQEPIPNQVPPGYPYGYPQQPVYTQKPTLPNAVAVLVLGILSILSSYYLVGIVLGIVALVLAAKGRKIWRQNPTAYSGVGMLNAGFVCAIIGTVIGSLFFIVGFFLGLVAAISGGLWALMQ
ncbi:MAG TPA: hypothetical protein H9888_05770 [Candidatus Rikenella faecigallinarum]|uniref:DUF4190 domain-containing protein n=1 Tax=Candidatus Rikenella faecigallinarum TaxID=2838745 RepID=A0A9D1TY47_9BACT|nr:hypothetical protein [Candidatus Rikenella faecigallinarum]